MKTIVKCGGILGLIALALACASLAQAQQEDKPGGKDGKGAMVQKNAGG